MIRQVDKDRLTWPGILKLRCDQENLSWSTPMATQADFHPSAFYVGCPAQPIGESHRSFFSGRQGFHGPIQDHAGRLILNVVDWLEVPIPAHVAPFPSADNNTFHRG